MTLVHLLAASAARHPDRPAVRAGEEELTYAQLHGRASGLARVLRDEGVRAGDRVGVFCPKSVEAVVGIHGILASGAGYVALDVAAPPARLRTLVRDCGMRHIVTTDAASARLAAVLTTTGSGGEAECGVRSVLGARAVPGCDLRAIGWAGIPSDDRGLPADMPSVEADALAYILYTSGSTGVPKGITHTHRSARAFVDWACDTFEPAPDDRLASHAPFHFDLSIFDLFAAAASGAATVLIPPAVAAMPASLSQLIAQERLTFWYSVPFALIQLLERGALHARDLRSLRCVLFAGEQLAVPYLVRLRRLLPQVRLANLYGPTETNVCTWYDVPADAAEVEALARVPIGQACHGTELFLADTDLRPAPPGGVGELLVRGPTVMSGYWNAEAATARALVHIAAASATPAAPDAASAPFYRTGDLVRRDPGGDYIFLGRGDRQIKLRGFRVELDEIEGALSAHQAVREAAVFLRVADREEPVISAAAVLHDPRAADGAELLAHLAARLPPYAVPDSITIHAAFPRTSTGKLDRNALRAGI